MACALEARRIRELLCLSPYLEKFAAEQFSLETATMKEKLKAREEKVSAPHPMNRGEACRGQNA